MKTFLTVDIYTNILNLDGLKCKLKSVYAADFAMQASSIKEVTEIIQELELNQAQAEVTKLLQLILTIPASSASGERSSSSLKCINNYMRCSQTEEQLSDLVLISIYKDLLSKMKEELSSDRFYNKVINEFVKKKQRMELIYK